MKISYRFLILALVITGFAASATAQPRLQKDFTSTLEIPDIVTLESSPAHMYTLSESEGMVVFRAHSDSLQYLYSSSGMENRGNSITADVRFAYLFGDNERLTVLEPTSVLGVYSSTNLPDRPIDARRMDQQLYVTLASGELGHLSLETPAAVDSAFTVIEENDMKEKKVIDMETSSNRLFALTDDGAISIFEESDGGIEFDEERSLNEDINRLFYINENLMGTDEDGSIYEINSSGELSELGSIDEPVTMMKGWDDWLIIRGESDRLWTSYQNREPSLWKDDDEAGNHFTVVKNQLWLAEYDKLNRITEVESDDSTANDTADDDASLELKEIEDQTIPYPNALLLPIALENNFPADQVQFSYESQVENAQIRGQGFRWKPGSGDIGTHNFKIIATSSDGQADSTSFSVEVTSFNAPPQFNPVRSITIGVDEEFTLPIKARDSDSMNRDLVRYLGVDLPEGASIDEKTGEFTWTPTARQEGENTFRVIATDQYGAAASQEITIKVVEASRADEEDKENE